MIEISNSETRFFYLIGPADGANIFFQREKLFSGKSVPAARGQRLPPRAGARTRLTGANQNHVLRLTGGELGRLSDTNVSAVSEMCGDEHFRSADGLMRR